MAGTYVLAAASEVMRRSDGAYDVNLDDESREQLHELLVKLASLLFALASLSPRHGEFAIQLPEPILQHLLLFPEALLLLRESPRQDRVRFFQLFAGGLG